MYGAENAVSYKYRVHDLRLGRFLSLDPLAPEYPWNSPYAFSENRVVDAVELEGAEASPLNEDVPLSEQEVSLIQEAESLYEADNGLIGVDPLDHMQVRVNRASNLNIPSRTRSDGTQYTHAGFDLFAPVGTSVRSVSEGRVVDVYDNSTNGGAYGMSITIAHKGNVSGELERYYTFYAHLSVANVVEGDHVLGGQVIGQAGQTGNANGQSAINSHLHFEAGLETFTSFRGQMLLSASQRISPNKVMPTKFYKLGDGNTGTSSVFSIQKEIYRGPGASMLNGKYTDFTFKVSVWPRSTYNNQNNPSNPSFESSSKCLPCLKVNRN